ncbi:phospholipase-like protein [Tanacetum coccineum]
MVEFHEDLSRVPYSRRTKVKLPECVDKVYALGDDISYIFPWGNYDIYVYRSFWLNLLGLKEGGWLSDRHLDVWFDLMWSFRPTDADWAIASSYFCGFVMRGDIPRWVCNGVRYPVMWADMEQVFETRKWWIKMRKAFKKYIPPYLQEWGILDAKGIPLESYKINFVVGKDVPIQGDAYGDCGVWVCIFLYRLIHKMAVSAKDPQIVGLAYQEHMFDYFWKYKIAS